MALSGTLTKKLLEYLGAGRHGDKGELYPVVDPSEASRWIVRMVVKGQKNKKGTPLRPDFGWAVLMLSPPIKRLNGYTNIAA